MMLKYKWTCSLHVPLQRSLLSYQPTTLPILMTRKLTSMPNMKYETLGCTILLMKALLMKKMTKMTRNQKTTSERRKSLLCLSLVSFSCSSCVVIVVKTLSTMNTLHMVTGTCPDGQWIPVRDIGAGNLLVAAAILFCGLTFTGISNLAKLLNLAMFSESTFYRLQRE